jgi:hypothetical protein
MKRRLLPCLWLVTLATAHIFAEPVEINDVRVDTQGNHVSIEVHLTGAITPRLSFARNPDRLIADFPNTLPKPALRDISVQQNGVERVRVGLNRAHPPVTRVVVDLDSWHPFGIETSGDKVWVNILPTQAQPRAAAQADGSPTLRAGLSPFPGVPRHTSPPAIATALPANELTGVALRTRLEFKVKGIAANVVYLDGGSNAGLQEGMKLVVCPARASSSAADPASESPAATLRVIAVATSSAVAEIEQAKREVRRGDRAVLTPEDAQRMQIVAGARNLAAIRSAPHTPLLSSSPQHPGATSEGSHIRGRIGLDYSGISSSGSTPGFSTQMGMSIESDMANLFGTHWNLQGYWRGRINRHSQFHEPTIEDTLNKTYTMQLYYDNPDSAWVAGFGRLYLPWAVSLDTIDGGYFGRKLGGGVTTGIFAGSKPDPNSWDYAPDQRIAGSFVNYTGGSYDGLHISSTSGIALSSIGWKIDRPYVFFENEASYKRWITVYHSLIADSPHGVSTRGWRPGAGIDHSYLTVHLQPSPRLSFDVYHNYFRDVPTAATRIVGTGLVDKLLFQGVNVGVHFEPIRHVMVYTSLGRSKETGDRRRTLNQMYGLTWSEIAHTGLRADFHYSEFDSNFARGDYRVLSLSRQMTNRTFWNVQVGTQSLASPFTSNNTSKFVATSMDVNMGKHSFLQSGYTLVNGSDLTYRQWYLSWGFRFDHADADHHVAGPQSE